MNNSIIDPVTAAIAGAAAKHGSDLLSDAAPGGADETLRMARNLVLRIRLSPETGTAVLTAAAAIVEQPDAADRLEELRGAVATAVARDPMLASDLAIMMSDSGV